MRFNIKLKFKKDTFYNEDLSFLILAVLVIAPMIIIASGCAPKIDEFERETPSVHNGPKLTDSTLTKFADSKKIDDKILTLKESKFLSEKIEKLDIISGYINSDLLNYGKIKLKNEFKNAYLKNAYNTKKSFYTDIVHDQIKDDVLLNLKDIDKKLSQDTDKIIKVIQKHNDQYLKFPAEMSYRKKLNQTQFFIQSLKADIKKLNILPEFKEIFLAQLENESQSLLTRAINLDSDLTAATDLHTALTAIESFVKSADFELSAEDQITLGLGLRLSKTVNELTDAPSALQALALVWSLLDSDSRKQLIASANKDLYEFFDDASESEILCYSEKNCRGLKSKIILNLGVYPQLEKFGLSNIKDQINQKSISFVLEKVNSVSTATLETVGHLVVEKTLKSVTDKKSDLKKFGKNLRTLLAEGLNKVVKPDPNVAYNPFISTDSSPWPSLELQLQYMRNNISRLKTETDIESVRTTQIELIEALAGLSMYSKSPEKPGFLLREEIPALISNPAARQYLDSPKTANREVRLSHQSDILNTMAALLEQTADWKPTSFDQGASEIKAEDILTDFKSEQLKRSFFPKSELTAMTISVATQVLYLIQSEFSPLILIDSQNQLVTIESFNSGKSGPIVLVAATDFLNGHRVNTVKLKDLAQLLLAVNRVSEALDGIEQTAAESLKNVNSTGRTQVQELIAAQGSLKRLAVGLANFISHQMRLPTGLVASSLSLYNQVIGNDYPQLLDQTLAIETLIKTYESTKIEIYLWSALDIYYALNQNMYSDKDGFYRRGRDRKAPLSFATHEVFALYASLLPMKKYLNSTSQAQFDQIFDPWVKASLLKLRN